MTATAPGSPTGAAPGSDPIGETAPRIDDVVDATPATGRSLEHNSMALAVSALVTGVVGLAYWAIVGRLYPASEVGAASAVITTATMLSAFGNLSIGALFERFLPLAGIRSKSMVCTGFLVGAGFGTALGAGFLFWGPIEEMFHGRLDAALFPAVVAVLSAFALLDHTSVGLREAGWAATKNVAHSVVKLAAVVLFAYTASRLAIVWTWILPAAVAVVLLGLRVGQRLRHQESRADGSDLPPRRELGEFLVGAYGIYVVGALAPLVLPLIVIDRLGADANAYFAITWSLVTSVVVLLAMLMGPYVAAAAADADRTWQLTLRFLAILGLVATGGVMLFALIGPVLLRIVGPEYADAGTPLLHWAALALVPAVVSFAYNAVARVQRRLRLAVTVQVVNAAIVLGASWVLIGDHGLVALGKAYVVAESVSAVLLVVPLVLALIRMRRDAQRSVNWIADSVGANSPS
ncbi:lipopolysaccharide biosynthesis protein [Rhodococcus sp. Z13]|uniref:Lipopolysaccharide biosynthesis protein n=1 Tax=Rhodococcus sacchari TaxID=2962047 RepID=A0ACD4DJ12_9NOCA|nr:lipopolysaccharide biosynthesis protein [Rhodococcus sp. Z13]UYP19953.1 lipopolysaccharide biosynthesis protein [Rhodococcus sp. Z13]